MLESVEILSEVVIVGVKIEYVAENQSLFVIVVA